MVGFEDYPTRVTKFHTSTLTEAATWSEAVLEDDCSSLAFDGQHLYAGLDMSPAQVIKIDLDTLETTVKDYAYETRPGVAVPAGAVPEPGTLGMLALGAAGLLAWRTLRKKQAGRDSP